MVKKKQKHATIIYKRPLHGYNHKLSAQPNQNNHNYELICEFISWTVQSVFEVLVELWFVGILFEEVGIFYHCLTLWHSYIQCNVMVQCNFFLAISSRCFRIDSLAAHKWAWIILTGGGFWHTDLLLFFCIIHHEFWPNQCFEVQPNNFY